MTVSSGDSGVSSDGPGSDGKDALEGSDGRMDGTAGDGVAEDSPDDDGGCPAAPAKGACTTLGQHCEYGATQCDCFPGGTIQYWSCNECPTAQPANGATCMMPSLPGPYVCSYGANHCTCAELFEPDGGFYNGWTCGTCPVAVPTGGAACSVKDVTCGPYGDAGLTCTCANDWSCTFPCPADPPTPGDACMIDQALKCKYGTETCTCTQGVIFCN